mgnify:CR=1 FL=1
MRLIQSINIIIGSSPQSPSQKVCDSVLRNIKGITHLSCLPAVFFITGLVLKTDDLKKALRQRLGVLYGLISIMGLTPLLGFGYRELPLTPSGFTAGAAAWDP